MFGHHHDGDEPTSTALGHFWFHLRETRMASEKLTAALADLQTAAAAVEAERNNQTPDPRIAELEAENATLTQQLADATAATAAATASDDDVAGQIETVVGQLTPSAETPPATA